MAEKKSLNEILEGAGLGMVDRGKLVADIAVNPNVRNLLKQSEGKIGDVQREQVITALAKKWQQDPSIIGKLDSDLGKSPAVGQKLQDLVVKDPKAFTTGVLPKYNGSNLAEVVAQASPAPSAPKPDVVAAAGVPAAGKSDAKPKGQEPPKRAPTARAPDTPAPVAAPVPSPSADRPAAAPPTVAAPAAVPAASMSAGDRELFKQTFIQIAAQPNEKIAAAIDKDFVVGMAEGIAAQAKKYGVEDGTSKAFVERIRKDPKLQQDIADNLKKNPDFIRELAKSMKDEKEPADGIKSLAKQKMTEFMSQPEKLADSNYVSSLTSQMKMGSTMSGFGGILSKFGIDLSGVGNFFQKIFDWVRNFVNEFTGGNFASMQSSGRGFFQSFQHSAQNASMNAEMEASMRGKLKVEPLIGANGKPSYTHMEPMRDDKGQILKNKDGSPADTPVQNKIEVETRGGKIKVLPTSGAEAVRQPDGGYKVWLAETMDDKGRPQKLIQANMTADQFETYNANLRQYGDRNNPPQYQMYDEAVRGPQQLPVRPETNRVIVDQRSGAVTDAPAANDRRYEPSREPAQNDPSVKPTPMSA